MKDTFEVVVIGAGPTGLKAAVTLATHGVETLLVDENHQTGGQYLRRPPSGPLPLSGWMPPAKRAGLSLIEKLPSLPSLTVMSATTLLSLQRGFTLALQSPGGLLQVKTDRLIIATGTTPRPEETPGMADDLGGDVHEFYTFAGATALLMSVPLRFLVRPLGRLRDARIRQPRGRIRRSGAAPATGNGTKKWHEASNDKRSWVCCTLA